MTNPARIVSFLPSATEMACALGLGDQLVGITHECDYPPEVAGKPVVVRNVLPIEKMGQATGRENAAEELISAGRVRLEKIASVTRTLSQRPRVFCMEWLDPVYCGGHWMPELVEIAGGVDSLARKGADSIRIPWNDVLAWAPEVLIITPCGFNLDKVIEQTPQLFSYPGWSDLPAVRNGRVYAVDANAYFARPGPRVVDGTELLAHLIHPQLFHWKGAQEAFRRIEFSKSVPTSFSVAGSS